MENGILKEKWRGGLEEEEKAFWDEKERGVYGVMIIQPPPKKPSLSPSSFTFIISPGVHDNKLQKRRVS